MYTLSSAIRRAAGSWLTVHRLTLSIHAVIRLPGITFPLSLCRSHNQPLTSSLLFQCLYLAKFLFSVAEVVNSPLLRDPNICFYLVQLIRITRLQYHNSYAKISFSSHFFTTKPMYWRRRCWSCEIEDGDIDIHSLSYRSDIAKGYTYCTSVVPVCLLRTNDVNPNLFPSSMSSTLT